jgi:GDPmannose 4,6-dehydratase
MQWMMLQQEEPEDFVIATGRQYDIRQFVETAAGELGLGLRWEGAGVQEKGIVDTISNEGLELKGNPIPFTPSLSPGQTIVQVDPRYFRPTEVESLLGDPSKAREKLGWVPRTSFKALVAEMVQEDFREAERDALCQREGFKTFRHEE